MLLPAIVVVLGAGVLCVAWGVLIERRWYQLVRHRLDILPADGAGPAELTILHLSDLHFVVGDRRKAAFLAALPPADVTIVTGDFLAEPEAVETVVAAVAPARGRLASWFVLGSNDYFVPKPLNYLRYFSTRRRPRSARRGRSSDLIAQLEADGWVHVRNSRRDVDLEGLPVELLGLDDAHINWHDSRAIPRSAPERFGLAVMHSPDSAPESAACGYDLILAGHTHGGQVRLPVVGPLVTNSTMPRRLASGLIRMGSALMYLSPGLGTSKFAPFRFLCRPEATLLVLRRRPAGAQRPSEATSAKTRS